MKRKIGNNLLHKTRYLYRFTAVLLCLSMVFTVWGSNAIYTTTQAISSYAASTSRADIKASLLKKIKNEGWDPYSEDMSIEEFYALMELFEEGKLPLKSSNVAGSPGLGAPGMDEPGIEEPSTTEENVYIPRTMFMFSGLENYEGENPPLPYDNENGTDDYPPGLDIYRQGYMIPPMIWQGVPLKNTNGSTEAVVIVPGANKDKPSVAGDVDQDLFLQYDNHYVRRVTAENTEVTILGAIKLLGSNTYVYYYLTDDSQEHDVSTTILPEGQKFIVEYATNEHLVSYELYMDSINGSTSLPSGISMDSIFGADRPIKTDNGKYAFTATVPYGYTLELYLQEKGKERKTALGLDEQGSYTTVNEGWALGKDPIYDKASGFSVLPDTSQGPSTLTMSGTFYNNEVTLDRTVIGVLKSKAEPTFSFVAIQKRTDGVGGGGSGRGTVAKEGYNWEADYEYNVNNKGENPYPNRPASWGNLGATEDRNWNWYTSRLMQPQKMEKTSDGTYSYSFVFQTNDADKNYLMDALEVNGIGISIPFWPRYVEPGKGFSAATGTGTSQWFTETTLPDGAKIRVEYLYVFGNTQRHYRISVTNARSNVSITGMNLMMYNGGAAEFSAYHFEGVNTGDSQVSAVEFYNKNNQWTTAALSNVYIDQGSTGLNTNGNGAYFGANFRFKLADGYDSPYYLWESTQSGVIPGTDGKLQASATRDENTGEVTQWNQVKALSSAGDTLDSQYIYGPDEEGYYYFRVSSQKPYSIALLTVVARPVRYVVRYVPSYKSVGKTAPTEDSTVGIIDNPSNMPRFTHDDVKCHPSFHWETTNGINGWEYDDKNGDYYDTAVDSVVILPSDSPTDPENNYLFVDWILVDDNFQPVTDESGNEFRYRGSNITLADINQYSIPNENLGGNDTDIYVLRLMPTWRQITNPFNYKVALNWVDATGELHEKYFDDFWKEVLTDWDIDKGGLTVKVLTDATPFLDWIAQHPTYTFWDAVNNNNALYRYASEHDGTVDDAGRAAMRDEMAKAIEDYLPALLEPDNKDQYDKVLQALCKRDISGKGSVDNQGNDYDDFWRLGDYAFQVFEDDGTIVVWMYENKGGLVFHKDVQDESFIANDEFYFTVSNVQVGNSQDLNGTYKAYPEQAYDENGKPRDTLDKDAWLVTFKNGTITSIVKNDGSATPADPDTFFTLKDGEGIMLYIPKGEYTITELGSKSGGSYRVDVDYNGDKDPSEDSSWELPNGEQWLSGSATEYYDPEDPDYPDDVKQVSAKVKFDVGEQNVVHTLNFFNQTTSLSIEKQLDGEDVSKIPAEYYNMSFTFDVTLKLPNGYTPLGDPGYYYFNMNIYNVANGSLIPKSENKILLSTKDDPQDGKVWTGTVILKPGQRAVIVMTVPEQGESINYWVYEKDNVSGFPEDLTAIYYGNTGHSDPSDTAKVKIVNYYGDLPEYGYLAITENYGEANPDKETFLYKIKNNETGDELIVSVKRGGKTIVYVPSGKYTVEEITDWAWRYEDGVCEQSKDDPKGKKAVVEVTSANNTPENAAHADYTNERNDKVWLGGENSLDNHFEDSESDNEDQESHSNKKEYALFVANNDKKRRRFSDGVL